MSLLGLYLTSWDNGHFYHVTKWIACFMVFQHSHCNVNQGVLGHVRQELFLKCPIQKCCSYGFLQRTAKIISSVSLTGSTYQSHKNTLTKVSKYLHPNHTTCIYRITIICQFSGISTHEASSAKTNFLQDKGDKGVYVS